MFKDKAYNVAGKTSTARSIKDVELAIININDLTPHEDIDLVHFRQVLKDLYLNKVVKPIIIDEKRSIIIDGHHRVKALKTLGVYFIPAFIASYDKHIDRIGSWMYIADLNQATLKTSSVLINILESNVKRGSSSLYVKVGEIFQHIYVDALDLYVTLNELRKDSMFNDFIRVFKKTPYNSKLCSSHDICIILPELSVSEIYKVAAKGLTLPPRTTYHITDLKNTKILIPINVLKTIRGAYECI
ncbi:MAG: ParB N-terminal domain-containing protein [Desulfurococcaceae archaeon]|jgi:hypothetical protein|nr:ParB N-terminal domain-containing protein [Desulfurococcaceae archaeon]